jgi:hypothetical protein
MSRIRRLMAVMAMCVLGACGGSGTDKAGDPSPPSAESESSAPTSTPDFSVATWNQEWSSAKQKYVYALQAFNNQLDLLNKSGATDQQFAMVVTTNARAVADAAGALVKKLGEASPIPAERADLQTAVDNLRAALINEEKAYRTSANCRRELKCLRAAEPAVVEAATRSGSALGAMPSE